MSMLKLFVGIAIAALIGVGVFFLVQKSKAQAAAQQEVTQQQSEKQECAKRLTFFYQAWKRYKADHKGTEPSSIQMLVPKYIPDTKMLVCPTAQRWISKHKSIDQGIIKINNQDVAATYGFEWLGGNGPRNIKKMGDKAPLVSCSAHEEGLYLAIFNKKPNVGAFDAETREKYGTELKNAHPLVVRRNGTVEELSASEE